MKASTKEDIMNYKLRPLEDRVVVKPLEAEEKTSGGILLPDTAKEKPVKGEVIAVGSGKVVKSGKRLAMAVKTGDRVVYGKYAGTDVKLNGSEYKVLNESDILAVID